MKSLGLVLSVLSATALPCASATFTVTNTLDGGSGSLSNAIVQANAAAGTNTIAFNILPLDGTVKTIFVTNQLPLITQAVIIDGYTQDPAHSHTNTLANADDAVLLIELNGTNASGIDGLTFGSGSGSSGSVVRGLVLNNFGSSAIRTTDPNISGFVIEGNFIGTDPTGRFPRGNVRLTLVDAAVNLVNAGCRIGGTSPGARNVISGNVRGGLVSGDGFNGGNSLIQGNFIGVDATGTNALGNGSHGVQVKISSDVVGGTNSAARNVISGNGGHGVVVNVVAGDPFHIHDVSVLGNYIGTDVNGTRLLPNGGSGVVVNGSTNVLIGGATAVAGTPPGNLIAGNSSHGVAVGSLFAAFDTRVQGNTITANQGDGVFIQGPSARNNVSSNSIFANAGLGIRLSGGGNNSQTNPVLTSAATGLGNASLGGSLKSGTNSVYRLEFFSNASCDGSGFGEGQVFLGATNLTTDANGEVPFIMILANPAGHANFTATATDTNGDTSAFSPCMSVSGPCVLNCSTNMVVSTAPNQCGAIVNFTPSTSGNCGAVNCTPPSGSFFPKGTNTVTCTSATGTNCSFTITVLDTFAPSVTCPANITTNIPAAQSNVVVNFSAPVFADNCSLASTNVSPASGSLFPLGVTTVTCTATDTSGNTNICSFTITVTHTNAPPVAQCQNVITNADGICQAAVTAAAVDNGSFDPDGTITNRFLNPPGPYPKGTNTVNFTVMDDQGGSNSCLASIVVLDTTLPTVICPANIITNAPPGQTSVVVNYPAAITTDNCPGSTNNTSVPASGAVFPLGTTTVTCSGTDASKNTNFCSFTVTVNPTPIDRVWTNVLGGNYHTAANWQSNVVPTFLDNARFVSNASYQVSWTTDGTAANAFFDAASGTVTQAIGIRVWLLTNSYVIGPNSGSTASVALVNGTLRVTNSARTGLFEVRRGTNRFNSGLMEVDRLVMTNTAGKFEFTGGTLNTHGAAITNNATFNVGGSGGTPATWGVLSGTNVARFGVHVGRDATNNLLIVTNGARLISPGAFVGFGSNARSNMAIVAGVGSVWDGGTDFDFGGGGVSNQLIVKLGGTIVDSDAIIGNGGGIGNSVLVNGSGSVWSNATLSMYGSSNRLTVSAGGYLSSESGLIDGTIASGSFNKVFIDPGGLWDAGVLYVGSSASFNQLVISNAAKVSSSEMYIGFDPTGTNNIVVIGGGTLQVTNPAFTAPLEVRYGTNRFNNGFITADRLLMTNALGFFEFNAGTLNVRASTVANTQPFLVGDGASAATLDLVGGVHAFANGLTIRSNALLMGNGTISGAFTAQSGGIVNPATAPGVPAGLLVNGSVTLQSNSVLRILLNGTTPGSGYSQLKMTNSGIQVSLNSPTLELVPGFTPAIGDAFIIFDNQTGFGQSGPGFNGLPQGTIFTNSGFFFQISYSGGNGNDVTVTRVAPPPAPVPAIPISSGNYTQDFNTLAANGFTINLWSNATTLAGWYASQSLSPFNITNYHSSAGTDNTGALYSYGPVSSSERALGSLSSGTPGTIGFGLCFTNDTGHTVTNCTFAYTGEQWRSGGNGSVTNTLSFWYRVSSSLISDPDPASNVGWTAVTSLDFASPTVLTNSAGALDGNQSTNQHPFLAVQVSGFNVPAGQNVFFRWLDINDTGSDQGIAVDNLSISFLPAPPRITSIVSNPTNKFTQLTGQGDANTSYGIEAASNLIFWQRLGNNTANGAGIFQFTDTNAPLFPNRFYRAVFP